MSVKWTMAPVAGDCYRWRPARDVFNRLDVGRHGPGAHAGVAVHLLVHFALRGLAADGSSERDLAKVRGRRLGGEAGFLEPGGDGLYLLHDADDVAAVVGVVAGDLICSVVADSRVLNRQLILVVIACDLNTKANIVRYHARDDVKF